MKTVLKSTWNNKRVVVSIAERYHPNGFNSAFQMRIRVEDTHLLPSKFVKGYMHLANRDIIDTLGGLPNYLALILNNAYCIHQEKQTRPIKEQLCLF